METAVREQTGREQRTNRSKVRAQQVVLVNKCGGSGQQGTQENKSTYLMGVGRFQPGALSVSLEWCVHLAPTYKPFQ